MHSNLERFTSMLLVASAITLVGANSSAQARRYEQPRMLVSATEASQWSTNSFVRWSDGGRSWRHGRRAHWQSRAANEWNDWSAAPQAYADWGSARQGTFQNTAQGWSSNERRTSRRVRVASLGNGTYGASRGGGSDVVAEARRWIGTNPTGWSSLWCARFMNFVLERTGRRGTGSNLAFSFEHYGSRVGGPQVGAIAVMGRRGGGHVGIVSGVDSAGNPVIISGNYGRRVAEAVYPRSRVVAYVMP
jgi:uncharacterized protein (TIGR02594 family)